MSKNCLKRTMAAAFMSFLFIALPAFAEDQHAAPPALHDHIMMKAADAPAEPSANPLKEEMMVLDAAFREIVSGVALGDGGKVLGAIESLHGRMEKTLEAVHSGAVKPPKNPGRLKEFVAFDKAFHSDLESLAKAAGKNDQPKMLLNTKRLLDGCVKCHGTFRK